MNILVNFHEGGTDASTYFGKSYTPTGITFDNIIVSGTDDIAYVFAFDGVPEDISLEKITIDITNNLGVDYGGFYADVYTEGISGVWLNCGDNLFMVVLHVPIIKYTTEEKIIESFFCSINIAGNTFKEVKIVQTCCKQECGNTELIFPEWGSRSDFEALTEKYYDWSASNGGTGATSEFTSTGFTISVDMGNKTSIDEGFTSIMRKNEVDGYLYGVKISECVTEIEPNSFSGFTGIETVSFPDKLETIGKSAFSGCTSLTGVSFGRFLKIISKSAFDGCSSITEINFNDFTVAIIEKRAFVCSGLTTFTLPCTLSAETDSFLFSKLSESDTYYAGNTNEFKYSKDVLGLVPDCSSFYPSIQNIKCAVDRETVSLCQLPLSL